MTLPLSYSRAPVARPAVRLRPLLDLVARGGFEPPKPLGRQIYSLLRLTAPQPRRIRSSPGSVSPGAPVPELPLDRVEWDRVFNACGAGEGIRTPDPLITNQPLYRTELRQPDELEMIAEPVRPDKGRGSPGCTSGK